MVLTTITNTYHLTSPHTNPQLTGSTTNPFDSPIVTNAIDSDLLAFALAVFLCFIIILPFVKPIR